MGYQILQGDPTEYEVIEYPSFADEREFSRLLVNTDEAIVPRDQKAELCEKWGWDPETACSQDIVGYVDYHLELAKTILKDVGNLTQDDADQLRPGKIQEARMDFIQGCHGRSDAQANASAQGLMAAMKFLLGRGETQTAATQTD